MLQKNATVHFSEGGDEMASKRQGTILFYGFIGLGACFFCAMLFAVAYYGNRVERKVRASAASAAYNNPSPAYILTADELYAEYQQNQLAAAAKYEGKIVVVSGAIASIREDITGTPYLLLSIKDMLIGGVQCYFKKENKYRLMNLSKSQQVRIRGRVGSMTIGYIGIKDCQLQSTDNH